MTNLHGIVYAFHSFPELGPLQLPRTAASLPFCGRYRLIDFSLSAMMNCGISDVGVIMQRDYQSLLDHLGGGKEWNLSRRDGGMRMLPPFGMPSSHLGEYKGCMEALAAVRAYINDIRQDDVLLTRGDLVANLDLAAVYQNHISSGADITAICSSNTPNGQHYRYIVDSNSRVEEMLSVHGQNTEGVASMEVYIVSKAMLLKMIDYCSAHRLMHFHRDAIKHFLTNGGEMNVYMHPGYCRHVSTVKEYFCGNMDMLDRDNLEHVFNARRSVYTKEHADVSTYYGESAVTKNCLIADGCRIDGQLENCIIFRGSVIEEGANLKNCIIMQNTIVHKDAKLTNLISDKNVIITEDITLSGSLELPLIVPKGTKL